MNRALPQWPGLDAISLADFGGGVEPWSVRSG
jgi:hypothetical protein